MKKIKLLDKEFEISISNYKINRAIKKIARQMNQDLALKEVIFLGILNGSFMFAAELFKYLDIICKISFLKVASYEGTSSTGSIKSLIGINEELNGKTVVILEDIVDSGNTLSQVIKYLEEFKPFEIKIATLLLKPDTFNGSFTIDYYGLEIPNEFIVGFGLDYNGYGRNLVNIYSIVEN